MSVIVSFCKQHKGEKKEVHQNLRPAPSTVTAEEEPV